MYKSSLYYKLGHLFLSLPYLTVQRAVTDYLKLKKDYMIYVKIIVHEVGMKSWQCGLSYTIALN